jgi:AcrR family transcriptional regulator
MGRPRKFDTDKAIDTAVDLFWRNGYDKTSLSDLTKAIRINSPSFYFAFGSKENLFRLAFERYVSAHASYVVEALQQPSARSVAERFLNGCAESYTNRAHGTGCLNITCGLPCSEGADPVRRDLAKWRDVVRTKLRDRFKQAKSSGDLPADADVDQLARYILVVAWGMAVAAESGANRADLRRTAAWALRAWPS